MRLTNEQLANLPDGIGASESGGILGVDKYTTRVKIYYRKVEPSRLPAEEESQAAYWGHKREALVAEEYSEKTGYLIEPQSETIWSGDYPWMYCHLDYAAPKVNRNVEIKTASAYAAKYWGEPGTDEVPDTYKVQVMHQMIVTGYRVTDIAVLINGNDFRIYTVLYDPVLANIIIGKEKEFWYEHVMKKIPPEHETLKDLDLLYPKHDGNSIVADGLAENAIMQRREIDCSLRYLKTEKERIDMLIKGAMGDASVLTDDAGTPLASWTNQDTKRLDQKRIKREEPDFARAYMTTTRSRVLRIKKTYEED